MTIASKIIPQAIITLPGNPTRNPPHLVFLPRGRAGGFVLGARNLDLIADIGGLVLKRRGFVVRAEGVEAEGSEVVGEGAVEGDGDGEVAEGEGVEAKEGGEGEGEGKVATEWKPRVQLGDIMGILNKRAIEASEKERPTPDIRTGDIVEIKLEVPENRRRLSIFKGIVISKLNAGIHTTIRIRRIIAGVGVEIVFPVEVVEPKKNFSNLPMVSTPKTTITYYTNRIDPNSPTTDRTSTPKNSRFASLSQNSTPTSAINLTKPFELGSESGFVLRFRCRYSPNIKEIKVVSHRKVRRARLYYLRNKLPRFSTFK